MGEGEINMDAEKYIQSRLEFVRRNSTYGLIGKDYERSEQEFHCGVEESGGHAYNCNDCLNKCEEWHQWDKEMNK